MTMSRELEELENKEKRARYYQNFKSKHPNILTDKIKCSVCDGKYSYHHKSRHIRSKKHETALFIKEHP